MADRTIYDEVRYSSYPYAQTHPDRLATVAVLHGLRAPDTRGARVLELGCGAGGNLIAMAAGSPGISALGVDLASEPIEEGRRTIAAVGLDNIELRQADVLDLTDGELGEFDYVLAHGVYAWVPPEVRDALLAACRSHLTADGLAYVSYNAHPGGHIRRMLREAGQWYGRGEPDLVSRMGRAQELYRFLEWARAGAPDWWGGMLEAVIGPFAHAPLYRLVHDDLGEFWDPVWFADFVDHAARHRLAYVGDCDLGELLPGRVPDDVAERLEELTGGDRIATEQVADILRLVFFRQSVVCRDSRTPAAAPEPRVLRELHVALRSGAPDDAPAPDGGGSATAALLDSVLTLLRARAPDTLAFAELRAATGADPDALAETLLAGFRAELLMLHASPLVSGGADAERPVASPLARWQARTEAQVTSLAYTAVHMEEPAARLLLTLLDGTRDRAAIRSEFAERTGVRLGADDLDANLEQLAQLFLLVPQA